MSRLWCLQTLNTIPIWFLAGIAFIYRGLSHLDDTLITLCVMAFAMLLIFAALDERDDPWIRDGIACASSWLCSLACMTAFYFGSIPFTVLFAIGIVYCTFKTAQISHNKNVGRGVREPLWMLILTALP